MCEPSPAHPWVTFGPSSICEMQTGEQLYLTTAYNSSEKNALLKKEKKGKKASGQLGDAASL